MKKILIIEDDPIVARIYQNRLEKEGCKVEIATDGQTGFYRIHEFQPDAVLLDLMLPKMNGVEILKKIRAQSQFQKVPIIVFTNAYVPNMIQEAFQAGATQVFNKATLTPRQVIDALQTAMYLTTGDGGADQESPAGDPASAEAQAGAQGQAPAATPPPSTPAPQAPISTPSIPGVPPSPSAVPTPAPAASSAQQPSLQPTMPTRPTANATQDTEGQDADNPQERKFQEEVQETFTQTAPEILASIRKSMQEISKSQNDDERIPHLLDLYRRVHSLTGSAGIAGQHGISQIAAALEVLLRELHEKPKNVNASTMRTVAHAIDFIFEIFTRGTDDNLLLANPINILVVDDEILSRRAITYALEKAGLKSVSVEDPQQALKLAGENAYDLIFLDVQMPGMDGFDLCTKIREIPTNKETPVIFVTSLTDFKSRARSSLSGGTDLIAKPFMFMELSVKALTYVLRGRMLALGDGSAGNESAVA